MSTTNGTAWAERDGKKWRARYRTTRAASLEPGHTPANAEQQIEAALLHLAQQDTDD
jgi:hypothetical protein